MNIIHSRWFYRWWLPQFGCSVHNKLYSDLETLYFLSWLSLSVYLHLHSIPFFICLPVYLSDILAGWLLILYYCLRPFKFQIEHQCLPFMSFMPHWCLYWKVMRFILWYLLSRYSVYHLFFVLHSKKGIPEIMCVYLRSSSHTHTCGTVEMDRWEHFTVSGDRLEFHWITLFISFSNAPSLM